MLEYPALRSGEPFKQLDYCPLLDSTLFVLSSSTSFMTRRGSKTEEDNEVLKYSAQKDEFFFLTSKTSLLKLVTLAGMAECTTKRRTRFHRHNDGSDRRFMA